MQTGSLDGPANGSWSNRVQRTCLTLLGLLLGLALPGAARADDLLVGTIIGTSGSWNNDGDTKEKAMDGDISTFFDAPDPGNGDWVGLDFTAGLPKVITEVRYYPRSGLAGRMVNGVFQGARSADFSDAVTLFTITEQPPEGAMSVQAISDTNSYYFVRYLSPDGGYGNVAEVEFHGQDAVSPGAPLAPTGLTATPGDAQVTLDWSPASGATSYTIKRSVAQPNGPFTVIASGWSGTHFVDTNANNGLTYAYVVAAVNAAGESPDSTVVTAIPQAPQMFGAFRQLWTGLSSSVGNSLAALTNTANNPNWPNNPNPAYTRVFTNFETEVNLSLNYYGQRVRTFLVPPMDGAYTFWIASDDSSQLFLSSDETPAQVNTIAWVVHWTNSREWMRETNQQSAPITLQAGRRYYLEAIMQQGSGGNNLAVRWQLPDGTFEEPLAATSPSGTRLIPCTAIDAPPSIFQQPGSPTVVEGASPLLSVLVANQSPVTYQWQLNGTNLPGAAANLSAYTVTNVSLAQSGQLYTCVVSNSAGVVTSTPALLTVLPDTVPPIVTRAFNVGPTNVAVSFSKLVEAASATNLAGYAFTNGLPVTGAVLNADGQSVMLLTAPLTYGSNYWLVVNGVRDRLVMPNMIATNTQVQFLATPYANQDIGSPAIPSQLILGTNGVDVVAAGTDIGGNADQFSFNYQVRNGDFDISLRIAGLSPSDVWAKAGLMAREAFAPGSRFVAALATPAMSGCFSEYRSATNGPVATAGNFPANYPYTWLRLRRSGVLFSAYASYDGQTWSLLGSTTLALPSQVYVGLAVSSHDSDGTTTAQFRDITDQSGSVVTGVVTNPHEALGPSSRKTPIVISEIMYKPAPRTDGNNVEFVELYNSNPFFHDLSGYRLAGDIAYTFPSGTILPGGGFLVVAASPQGMQNVYGLANVYGPYTGSLKKAGTIELHDEHGAVLLTVPYSNLPPWPAAADGAGHSLVLAKPTYGEADPRAWDISDVVGGSPGQMEAFRPSPLRNVVINEFLAHTDPPDYDYIELYNHANQPVEISGCILTDDAATNKFVVPAGTIIPARGFVFYSETNMNFALSAAGETIFFKSPDASRVLDAVTFSGQENGVATGRWPDGTDQFYRLAAKTPGAPNGALRASDVVINELMYDPISGNDDDQFVELYNAGTNRVNLGGWRLEGGISYSFADNAALAPDGYLVVARNAARLRTNYANLNLTNCLGDFSGRLSHNGERLALTMADTIRSTNSSGTIVTNTIHIVMNEITYGSGGRWGQWSAGGGSSLELMDPHSNNRLAANWGDSDETTKSAWTNIEATGVLDNGANYDPSILYAQFGLLDAGECLVDNVEIFAVANPTNLVKNPDFESGLGNWWLQGDHVRSSLENGGYGASAHSLHVRCSDRIWTGDNSCEMALYTNSLAAGQTATLRFKARWLRGWPEALLRLNGNWLEATGPLPVPRNLGTPGQRNSRYITNAGPAIYEVTHTPAVPAASQAVVVTARIHDPDGVTSATLYYRVDPSLAYQGAAMHDDGLAGDVVARDGVFSATIPGQSANTVVAFHISTIDSRGATSRFPALVNDNAPVRECVVLFGDGNPAGSFPVYHLWITQTNATRWSSLSDLSNESHDCTIVNGTRVIYDAQARFAGSPYHQGFNTPYGNLCHYKWIFPDDDKFLGATSFNKLHQPGNGAGDDASLQREQVANSLLRALGVPWLNRHYVVVYVNGNRRGPLMEDAQTPDADVVKEHFPADKDGYLYKMQPWFEFGPFPSGASTPFNNNAWCDLMPHTTTGGVKKVARYRYNFLVRRTPDSASDYTNVFSLVDAASSFGKPNYVASMENLADMENWMRVFAANHAAGNWDSFGAQNAQNLYGYAGTLGTRYSLLMFDFNICLGNSGSWGPGQNLFTVNGADTNTANIYKEPTFRRMYWRAMQELINGPLDVANSGPLIDAKYNAFTAAGLTVENPVSIKNWLTTARSSIGSQLAAESASSFTVNPAVTLSNNLAFLTGTAPVAVDTISLNGTNWPVTWTSVTAWRAAIVLAPGTNRLSVVGVDRQDHPISSASNFVSVVYSGTAPSPAGQVVMNEINYAPVLPGAEYVELYNASTNFSFDLSGCELRGLAYTFPSGSLIAPGQFLVLVADRFAFAAAYGATNLVFDTFGGTLQSSGGTLTLVRPGTNAASDLVIAKVRYAASVPWPALPAGGGSALQLLDPRQDNWRLGNWAAVQSNTPPQPQWVYVTATGKATSSRLYLYLQSAGDIYLDNVKLVKGFVPEAGTNYVRNGDFESALAGTWTSTANFTNSALAPGVLHSGNSSLHLIATAGGTGSGNALYQDLSPALTLNQTYTISFWYLQTTNGGPVTLRLSSSGIVATTNPAPPALANLALATPGKTNSVAGPLPAFPPLWLNELQPVNLTGPTNRAGQHTAWLELYNPGTNALSLTGLYLTDSYTNLAKWSFPTGGVINAGEFKVIFADGQTNLSTLAEPHTSFSLAPGAGSLALSRITTNAQFQVLDYVDYTSLAADWSFGSFPDGQSFDRQAFFFVSPGGTNQGSSAPLSVAVNEWMAGNTLTLMNPVTGKYDDWFELYNYGSTPADLAGYYLSHSPTNQFEFAIPAGYTIPPHGFLVVWADKKNTNGTPDLHVNFKLSKSGTSIGLFGADGRPVDLVTFGAQTSDISEGRYPDGSGSIAVLGRPTPGTSNAPPNTPPVLLPIADKVLTLGQSLAFTAPATDTDSPPQTLTFTLGAGAAPGAQVDPASGLFTWAPTSAPDTNQFTVIVTDNGLPSLSATQTFLVNVVPPPALTGAAPAGQPLALTWSTTAGESYQLEYADSLVAPNWIPFGTSIPGTGDAVTVTNLPAASQQRFFRLRILP